MTTTTDCTCETSHDRCPVHDTDLCIGCNSQGAHLDVDTDGKCWLCREADRQWEIAEATALRMEREL